MSDIAIRVDGLSKQYRIGGPQQQFDRLGEQLFHALASPVRRAKKLLSGQATGAAELDQVFWALKDVSVEIKHGEAIGIIGRNGAGKTTLLKILSRITAPTAGSATIRGRIGSLLEVGTGFHPELTGRENVYLNGAILGMGREEIGRKFDEIVAFAEIEGFIDTPVKHYSSGMYVRLAFSVAAHLEPEIMLIDEVLAVGDVAFQKKCLGKMGDVTQEGRTVLFVSHSMGLVQSLCDRGIFIEQGRIVADGPTRQVIDSYLSYLANAESQSLNERTDRRGRGLTKLVRIRLVNKDNRPMTSIKSGDFVRFDLYVSDILPNMYCDIAIFDSLGQPVVRFSSRYSGDGDVRIAREEPVFSCELDDFPLLAGRYRVDVYIVGDEGLQDSIQSAAIFDVGEGIIGGRPVYPYTKTYFRVAVPHRWVVPIRSRK